MLSTWHHAHLGRDSQSAIRGGLVLSVTTSAEMGLKSCVFVCDGIVREAFENAVSDLKGGGVIAAPTSARALGSSPSFPEDPGTVVVVVSIAVVLWVSYKADTAWPEPKHPTEQDTSAPAPPSHHSWRVSFSAMTIVTFDPSRPLNACPPTCSRWSGAEERDLSKGWPDRARLVERRVRLVESREIVIVSPAWEALGHRNEPKERATKTHEAHEAAITSARWAPRTFWATLVGIAIALALACAEGAVALKPGLWWTVW